MGLLNFGLQNNEQPQVPDQVWYSADDMADMHAALETQRKVNVHLNAEVEKLTASLEQASAERDALQRLLSQVGQQLHEERIKSFQSQPAQDGCSAPAEGKPVLQGSGDLAACLLAVEGPDERRMEGGELHHEDGTTSLSGVGELDWSELSALVAAGLQGGWLINTHDLQILEPLGEGSSGVTYRAKYHGAIVAAKREHIRSKIDVLRFQREVKVLSRIRSPHVVSFIGACLEPPENCILVSELMEDGDLKQWLKRPRPLQDRLQIALQVVRGMQALEEVSPTCIHRDLKPSNILMGRDGRARIADFSLARYLPNTGEPLTGETGTYFYMAPEVIKHQKYSGKADVYSFGILLCELVSNITPYSDMFLTPVQVAVGVADRGLRPTVPQNCHPGLKAVITSAWDHEPNARPSFSNLVRQLEHIIPILCKSMEQADENNGWRLALGLKSIFISS